MPTLSEMKQSSPAYQALTDEEFADRVYKKHYAEKISRDEFDRRTAPVNYFDETVGQLGAGTNIGLDALINLPYNLVRSGAGALGYDLPQAQPIFERLNVTGEPRTGIGEVSRATGEVLGSSALPSGGLLAAGARMGPKVASGGNALTRGVKDLAQRAARDPRAFAAGEAASTVGAGAGIGLAREAEAGPETELIAGLAGGVLAPMAYATSARIGGGMRDAVSYGNRMVQRARKPQLAADQDVADALTKAGLSADDIRREVSPAPSAQLQARGKTGEDLADIISRYAAGEPTKKIARDHGIAESTVRSYVAKHREMTPTPRNIADVATDVAGAGQARSVTRLGRAASSIADDPDTTQALMGRQEAQGGRVQTIIGRAGAGRDYDAVVSQLDDVVDQQARTAYATAERNAQPFNLQPAIRRGRNRAFQSAGGIRQGLEKAIDLFFEPTMMGTTGRVRKLGQPIADLRRYQAAREALDDMISASYENNRPTRLTRKLIQFRSDVNRVVRNANPDMASADDLYSGARTSQDLLERGAELTTRLGAKTEDALRDFNKLTPEQKELFRLGFLRRLSQMADNTRDASAVASKFQTEAVRKIVRQLFGPEQIRKSMPKDQQKRLRQLNAALKQRGEGLIKALRQEATTTRTKNEFLSGSRTAELESDMGKMMQGAQTAADIATGRFGAILNDLSVKLSYQIGERQAKAIMEMLTETDPAKLLPMLNRLARQAQTTQQRQAYVTAIRELRRSQGLPLIGVGVTAAQDRDTAPGQ